MTLQVPSGDTNQGYSFHATPGLNTANFTVWRSRNGATATQMSSPTITEDGNLAGLYHLILDEDMSLTSGNVTEDHLFTVLHSDLPGFQEKIRIELFAPAPIRKNVAFANFSFRMLDSDDHATPIAGRAVTAERSIDGGAFAACANAVSEISDGAYSIDLAAADLNGNVIVLKFTAAGADTVFYTMIPARA